MSQQVTTKFRLATTSDDEALAHLRWTFFREEHDEAPSESFEAFCTRFRAFVAEAVDSGRWTIWVVEQQGQLVGNAWVYVVPKVPRPDRATRAIGYLTNVYVRAEARDHGSGTSLLRAIADWARSSELEGLIVWPSDASRRFYGRAGFEPSRDLMELPVLGYEE